MLLPIIWAAAFLFSVLNMHYPALASAPGAFLLGESGEYPACWRQAASSAGALRALRKFGQKENENCAISGVLAKDNSF